MSEEKENTKSNSSSVDAPHVGDYVTLHGLSKEDLNGRLGRVQNMNPNGRFNVQLSEGRVLALKPENLSKTESPGVATVAKDTFIRMKNDFKVKGAKKFAADEGRNFLTGFQGVLPVGIDPKQALIGFGAIFILSLIQLGFLKAFLLTQTLFAVFITAFPVFKRSGGGVQGAKSAVDALAKGLQESIQTSFGVSVGELPAKVGLLVLGLSLIFLLFFTGGKSSTAAAPGLSSAGYDSKYDVYKADMQTRKLINEAFQKGFQASTAGKDFQMAFDQFAEEAGNSKTTIDDAAEPVVLEDREYAEYKTGQGMFSLSKLLPLVFMGKMIFDLGGGRNWNPNVAWVNFQQEPVWKKALIVFAIARFFI